MARPYWSGELRISLVSFGVKLFPATSSTSEITFHQIDRESGKRVHHQNVVDGKPVENSQIIKGYEYSKGKYITLDPEEIDKLRISTRNTLEIVQFVERAEISPAFYEKPYFVVPQEDRNAAAFAVIRDALRATGKAGLGEITFAGREHLVAIAAADGKDARGLMAYTLRYREELRDAADYFREIAYTKVDKKEVDMADELIRNYTAPLDLSRFQDDYEAALQKLVEAKRSKKPLVMEEEKPQRGKVINLMEALRASVDRSGKARSAPKPAGERRTGNGRSRAKGPVLVKGSTRKRKTA